MWIAQGTQLGDGSGGANSIIFIFKGEGEPLGARFYNLEQVEIHNTLVTETDGSIQLFNFDIIGTTGLVTREIHTDLDTDGTTTAALVSGRLKLPIFMGRPQLVGVVSQLIFRTDNINMETSFFTAQGYIWEPRSLLMDGGLRRPLDSLYGGGG